MREIDSVEKLCLELPLYAKLDISENNVHLLKDIDSFKGTVTCYCPECRDESIFKAQKDQYPKFPGMGMPAETETQYLLQDHTIEIILFCVRNQNHQPAKFYFQIFQKQLIKIGQYPSLVELATIELKEFQKTLSRKEYTEFNRAIGLAAHGVGIGAFVYLRRIFENLLLETKEIAKQEIPNFNEGVFEDLHIDEKIECLKQYLPVFLAENKKIYGILSKGIHELDENECAEIFPIVRLGIELILREKIKRIEEQKKIKEASNLLEKLYAKMKK